VQALLDLLRFGCTRQDDSVIRHSPPVARTTATALCQLGTHGPYIPLAAIESIATILVMNVSAFTRPGVARWLWQLRSFTGEEPLATILLRRLLAAGSRLDADGVIGVGDVVKLHRTTGQLHGRLNALAMPPGQQVELHGRASSVN
jgi:hypothetical protein